MNYRDAMRHSIDYIEAHIGEELTVAGVAREAGYSPFHFCRFFTAEQGMPPSDYIRLRRLSLARAAMVRGDRILDAAVAYGFDTASGFSKAFRREFGYSPTAYLTRMSGWQLSGKTKNLGGMMMNPELKKRSAFKVAGYGIETNLAGGYLKDVAAYWDTYTGENLESKMYRLLNPPRHGEVGLCVPGAEEGAVLYLFGVIVENFDRVTAEMVTAEVPAAEYAVFTTPPVDLSRDGGTDPDPLSLAIKSTWKYIFEEWFPSSGYVYDEEKLDFEFYDERCHMRPDSVMEIWVPVK